MKGHKRKLWVFLLVFAMVIGFIREVGLTVQASGVEMYKGCFGNISYTLQTLKSGKSGVADAVNQLFDGNDNKKVCIIDLEATGTLKITIEFTCTRGEISPVNYAMVTGGDTAGNSHRNPKTWTLYGVRNGSRVQLDHQDDGGLPAANKQVKVFPLNLNGDSYSQFVLEITEVAGAHWDNQRQMQLAEFYFNDLTAVPTSTPNRYTVTYESNGGSEVAFQTLVSGEKLKKPNDPEKTGYTFFGWYQDKACTDIWDFDQDTVSSDITLYAKWKQDISRTVTFQVVNGSWNDGTKEKKTVSLTGYEGDVLKLSADQIPTAGRKPDNIYQAGSWDVTPNTSTAITSDITYTYTYEKKPVAAITKEPAAGNPVYTGESLALVASGEARGGEMQYALGKNSSVEPDASDYGSAIPTAAKAKSYYVWYRVKADEDHLDSEAACIKATIEKKEITVRGIRAEDKHFDGSTNAKLDYSEVLFDGICGNDRLTIEAEGTFENDDVGTLKTVGIQNLVLGGEDAGNYKLAEEGQQTEAKADIIANQFTMKTAGYSGIYDGEEHSVSVQAEETDVAIAYSDKEDGIYSRINPTYQNAGIYTVFYKVEKRGWQTVTGSETVEILKKAVTVKAEDQGVLLNKTIDTSVSQVKATGLLDGDILEDITLQGSSTENVTDHGKIVPSKAVIKNGETDVTENYEISYENGVLVVAKVKAVLKTAPKAVKDLIYDAKKQKLVTSAKAEGGTMQYVLGKDSKEEPKASDYADSVPVSADAGEYYVWYKVKGDKNHIDTEANCVKAEIGKANSYITTVPKAKSGLGYTGEALPLVNIGAVIGGEMKYALAKEGGEMPKGGWSSSLPMAVDAGSYTVFYYLEGDKNHWDTGTEDAPSGSLSVTVKKADAVIEEKPSAIAGLRYNGLSQKLMSEGKSQDGTWCYRLNQTGEWSYDLPSETEVGIYTVEYYFEGDENHKDIGSREIPQEKVLVVIGKGENSLLKLPESKSDLVYSGQPQELINLGEAEKGTLLYAVLKKESSLESEIVYSKDVPVETEAGEYTVCYYVEGDSGHEDVGSEREPLGSVNVIIEKAEAQEGELPTAVTGLTADGTEQKVITEGKSEHGVYWYSLELMGEWSKLLPSVKEAGIYTIYYYLKGDQNHQDIGSKEAPQGSISVVVATSYFKIGGTLELGAYTGEVELILMKSGEEEVIKGMKVLAGKNAEEVIFQEIPKETYELIVKWKDGTENVLKVPLEVK